MYLLQNNLPLVIMMAIILIALVVIVVAVVMHRRGDKRRSGSGGHARPTATKASGAKIDAKIGTKNSAKSGTRPASPARAASAAEKSEKPPVERSIGELTFTDIEALLDEPVMESTAQQRAREIEDAFVSKTRYVNVKAPVTCGFDFNHVVAAYITRPRSTAGAERPASRSVSVYASSRNFDKIKSDIGLLRSLFAALTSPGARSIYHAAFPDIEGMLDLLRPFGERSVALRGTENLALVTIESRNSDGSLKKCPVSVRAVTVRRSSLSANATSASLAALHDSLVLDLSYLPNGSIRKGRIVRWQNRSGSLCLFEWDGFAGNYLPTKIKVTDKPGTWRTVFEK